MATYEQKKQQALRLFDAAIAFAQQSQEKEYRQRLQQAAQQLDEGTFTVVVCGEFRRGKSSLLNAFLNEKDDLFPVDISVTTNLATTVRYGPVERISVLLGEANSDAIKTVAIKRGEIRQYVTEQNNPGNQREARLMQIELSNEQLKQGLMLVDTPGVGGLYARHSDVTYHFLPNADAVLFVSDAFEPLSAIDLAFIKERILPHTSYIIFVLTKKDDVKDYTTILENNRQKLAATLGQPEQEITIIPVSSRIKRAYLSSHDPEDLEDSNFLELERVLWQFIGANRGRILVARALTTLSYAISEMQRPLQVEFDTCQEQNAQRLNELEASLREARDILGQLQANNAQWQSQLRDGLEDIRVEAQYEFDRGFAEIRRKASGYIDERVLEKPERVLDPVQGDINDLLYALDRMIREKAERLQSNIEQTTGLALNPFAPESLYGRRKPLSADGFTPVPRGGSALDTAIDTIGSGFRQGNILGTIGSFFFGHVGRIVGDAVGWLLGMGRERKRSMQQVQDKDRRHIEEQLMNVLADSQRDHHHTLITTMRTLERAMRDELLSQIRHEMQSRQRALDSFQEARRLTKSEAEARVAILRGPLQQLERMRTEIESLMQEVMRRDDDPPGMRPSQAGPSGGPAPDSPQHQDAAQDRGEWADE